ncbi:permease [Schizophyllum amplum]|uniref:Permease n=1 Tax=Schizophyllum amplum TaxID=97359 RepID=A0A550CBY1_9AGAR|nr:permease [Auriculariopsis ampla]
MPLIQRVRNAVQLHGDEDKHEKTDSWSNRDLVPLPPARRTWGLFEYFGYWAISALNISTWQQPNSFLTLGLSVGQTMGVIIVGRFIVALFAIVVAWCGLRWHIGFTIQNRFSWGMRGSYIPLIQRVMLNFIWTAIQCWNGGKLVCVCITAVFPSFASMKNTLPASMPTTTYEMVGFTIFWFCSLPFLWMPPEKYRLPFQVVCIYCGVAMICMMIWALSVAKGVGPTFYTSQNLSGDWSINWVMLRCINSLIGGKAAGMTNGSDFSRYGKSARQFTTGTFLCLFIVGTLVSFVGLVTVSATQVIYNEVYWNPPDLLMRMMDEGHGSSKARAGVFFLALGFALTAGFENVCGNAVGGGIDLSGIFPHYINIRRGALITFFAAWICMPWQLVNRADTFITVLSSFTVFLAPMMGIMTTDFFLLRKQRVRLSSLYDLHGQYYYTYGFNWRAPLAWICGWAPLIGGLNATVEKETVAKSLFELYYLSFFLGYFISAIIFYGLNRLFPLPHLGESDDLDMFGTFTPAEAKFMGVAPADDKISDNGSSEKVVYADKLAEPDLEY